ncbi:hypothetical protein HHK36_012948 [Tetracentron sinense]|uniref:Uncharacterized protein n=1 Tax=Tetracentron sinense TaxID=13715 RepID=A0A834Z938_TETSI|nr:hypothetical protein HHK36_012948 [Tetracentron sinense]
MGSLIPFPQDLNLLPDPIICPKLEPKLEPLDEHLYFSNPNPNPNPNFNHPISISIPIPNLQQNPNSLQELSPLPEITTAEENEVDPEFFRISQLFQSSLQRYGDLAVLDPNSQAIVPYAGESRLSTAVVTSKKSKRSLELVRVTDLGIEDQRYFRELVRMTRMVFDSLRIFLTHEHAKGRSLDLGKRMMGNSKAASVMKDCGLWLNREKRIVGPIPGVYVGDVFFFRTELCVIGLHGQNQAGIDFVSANRSSNREPIATSIIVSGGYEDDEDAGDVIIYTGQGGQDRQLAKQCCHQKLEGGNLALERSMYYGIEVRVIRGIKYEGTATGKIYVYDGLYVILDSWFDVGKSGFGVFKYKLLRMADQPEMGSAMLKFAENLRANPLSTRLTGYLSLDISMKKENVPVYLFNDIDSNQDPLFFEYLVKPVHPPFIFQQMSNVMGCGCVSGCLDDCYCAQKNGGEFAYDCNGILLRGKPLIFECGSFCRCPPTCRNRVSQKGLKNRFEVFRSRETGWGVRSLDMIPSGAFICEFTGVVLNREQAAVFTMNGDSLVYPSRFTERWVEWGDLSKVFPQYVRPAYPSIPPLDFALDVSRMRNVACYISHSSSPNVLVQFVLYDHHNVFYPHLMLFAMEIIPPLRELSLDYGVADEWTEKLAICN